jgi:hypothetical protein
MRDGRAGSGDAAPGRDGPGSDAGLVALSIGENLQLLVDRPDGTYCFRLHNDRVYYVR